MGQHDSTEGWWDLFRRASELRTRLKDVQSNLQMEEKRDAMQGIRREAFDLLAQTHIPHPLKMLIVDLWGGSIPDGWAKTDRLARAKLAVALIEARQPGRIGEKRLATLLRNETGETVDPKTIKNWRRDLEYQYLVNVRRDPTEGG